jgi:hypothetical protein
VYELTGSGAWEVNRRVYGLGFQGDNYILCGELTVFEDAVVPLQSKDEKYEYGRPLYAIRVRGCWDWFSYLVEGWEAYRRDDYGYRRTRKAPSCLMVRPSYSAIYEHGSTGQPTGTPVGTLYKVKPNVWKLRAIY